MRGKLLPKVCGKASVSLNIEDVLPYGGYRGGQAVGGAGVEEEPQRSGLVTGLVECCEGAPCTGDIDLEKGISLWPMCARTSAVAGLSQEAKGWSLRAKAVTAARFGVDTVAFERLEGPTAAWVAGERQTAYFLIVWPSGGGGP